MILILNFCFDRVRGYLFGAALLVLILALSFFSTLGVVSPGSDFLGRGTFKEICGDECAQKTPFFVESGIYIGESEYATVSADAEEERFKFLLAFLCYHDIPCEAVEEIEYGFIFVPSSNCMSATFSDQAYLFPRGLSDEELLRCMTTRLFADSKLTQCQFNQVMANMFAELEQYSWITARSQVFKEQASVFC